MYHQIFKPHPALSDFIHFIGLMHIRLEEGAAPVVCPFPPMPQNCMLFYIDDPVKTRKEGTDSFKTYPPALIIGPQVTRVNLLVSRSHKAVMVAFHPGGMYRLLGLPLTEVFDDGYDAREIIGCETDLLIEQMQEAKDFEAIKNITEAYFLNKLDALRQVLPFDLAMKELLRNGGNVQVEKIAGLACLSLRQFERKCIERIGMSPRFFARITRFSRAYRMREQQKDLTWTNIAHSCGYFDQMHLIRDFKQFAGVTPRILESELPSEAFRMQAKLIV